MVGQNGGTVRHCRIVSGSGNWQNGIVNIGGGGTTATTTNVFENYIENTTTGYGVILGDHVHHNVIKNSGICMGALIFPATVTFGSGAVLEDNYCSGTVGVIAGGPSSGAPLEVNDNYVRAGADGVLQDGLTSFTKNIIDSPDDFMVGNPGGAAFSANLCDDPECEDPGDYPFALSFDFN